MRTTLKLAEPSDTVYYCDQPVIDRQTAEKKISKISIAQLTHKKEFRRGKDFQFSNNIVFSNEIKLTSDDHEKISALQEKLISADSFVICNMGVSGYGVYTTQQIAKGRILFYTGEYKPLNPSDKMPYGLKAGVSVNFGVDAEKTGGIASFFQDLFPLLSDKSQSVKTLLAYSDVATNNFVAKELTLSFGSLPYLETICDIKPYIQCGLKYSASYWNAVYFLNGGQERLFYNNRGHVITGHLAETLKMLSLSPEQTNALVENARLKKSDFNLSTFVPGMTQAPSNLVSYLDFVTKSKMKDKCTEPSIPSQEAKDQKNKETHETQDFEFMRGAFTKKKTDTPTVDVKTFDKKAAVEIAGKSDSGENASSQDKKDGLAFMQGAFRNRKGLF